MIPIKIETEPEFTEHERNAARVFWELLQTARGTTNYQWSTQRQEEQDAWCRVARAIEMRAAFGTFPFK